MANQINSNNISLFGLTYTPGSTDSLLPYAERKESTNHDFITEDGLDIDLGVPKFKDREVTLKCAMIAEGVNINACFTQFWNQYNALFTELRKPGTHSFYIDDHQKTYHLYYKKMNTVKKLTRISNLLKVGMIFDLVLGEPDPLQTIQPTYLVNHTGRFLVV